MVPGSFAALGVSDAVVADLAERGYVETFPIQAATIEAALAGRDICGKAPTGSGKTLAFGIPVVDLIESGSPWRPRALILAPTRELASQIKDELKPLAKAQGRSIVTVFGGTNIERDIRRLEKGVDILVACPGRLEDLIARRCCELRDIAIVVVDEADRMADMGFLPSVKRLLDQTPDDRHTMLFSATLDGDVDTLIKRYQKDPLTFEVEEEIGEPGDVEHSWYLIQPVDRIDSTVAVLRGYEASIVFCRTRRGCERIAKTLAKKGLGAVAIHGDRSQTQRERALADFVSGRAQVLVATDVAARGIHVDNVSLVMHYDPAGTDKDYIHRSGRTGRAGQQGRVISMVVEDKKKVARQLQKALGMKPGFDELDIASLPPAIQRPKPSPAPAREPQRDGRRDRPERDRGRGGESGRRGGRSDERDSTGRRSRRPRRQNKNDWYPPGHHDADDKSSRPWRKSDSGKSGSGKSDPGKSGSGKSGSGTSGSRGGRGQSSDDDRAQKSVGGQNTAARKSRAVKGRHTDKADAKNKGKRRKPRGG